MVKIDRLQENSGNPPSEISVQFFQPLLDRITKKLVSM